MLQLFSGNPRASANHSTGQLAMEKHAAKQRSMSSHKSSGKVMAKVSAAVAPFRDDMMKMAHPSGLMQQFDKMSNTIMGQVGKMFNMGSFGGATDMHSGLKDMMNFNRSTYFVSNRNVLIK